MPTGHPRASVAGTASGDSLTCRVSSLTIVNREADNTTMKRFLAITAVILGFAALASAQTPTNKPLADVAKDEESRRKGVRRPAKVYTNDSLVADISRGVAPPPSTAAPDAKPGNASPANTTPGAPNAAAGAAKDQAYWSARMAAARAAVERTQILADSLQSRINALTTDYVNRDDPAQRAKIEGDRKAALAELERTRKDLADQRKAITTIEDEARRAGAPNGWLRPGA